MPKKTINYGKEFEQDFKTSAESLDRVWLYRPSDFGGGQAARFTNHSLCDYILFNDATGKLFLLELKSVQGNSISCPGVTLCADIDFAQQLLLDVTDKETKKQRKEDLKNKLRKGNSYKIKYHQLSNLIQIETDIRYNNIETYIIINFRDYNKTFCCKPSKLIDILQHTHKSSVSVKELEEAECYIVPQESVRQTRHWLYNIEDVIYDKIN